METIRASVVCIIAAGIIGSIAMILIPGKKNNTIMKAIVSIFIVMSLFEPIKTVLNRFSNFTDVSKQAQAASAVLPKAVSEYIKDELEEIIISQARKYGVSILSVEAEITEEENCIKIHKIIVATNEKDANKLTEFEQSVSKTAGVEITAEIK